MWSRLSPKSIGNMKDKNTRVDDMVVRFTKAVIRFRWPVVIGTLLLSFLIGSGAKGLYFNTDYRAFFGEQNPQVQAFDELQKVYTKNDNILFVIAPQDGEVFTRQSLDAIEKLVDAAWTIPYSIRVDAITNFQHTFADLSTLI